MNKVNNILACPHCGNEVISLWKLLGPSMLFKLNPNKVHKECEGRIAFDFKVGVEFFIILMISFNSLDFFFRSFFSELFVDYNIYGRLIIFFILIFSLFLAYLPTIFYGRTLFQKYEE
ncbi:MAG: hypothetical protein ACJAS4_000023 [Bacteriovoracaceae bacterium]|jgi:hypothetical protein